MNGWQMNNGTHGTPYNDSGTKTWIPLGDTDNTRAVTTVPTTVSPTIEDGTIKHYELYYALDEPETEEIQPIIVGDGVNLVEGQNTVSAKSGVVYERAEPTLYNNESYHINWFSNDVHPYLNNPLPYKVGSLIKIIKVAEDGAKIDDTKNWNLGTNNMYGNCRFYTHKDNYDTESSYYVYYQVLQEDYNCQVQEVNLSYEDNIRGTVNELVEMVTNNDSNISDIMTYLSQLEERINTLES